MNFGSSISTLLIPLLLRRYGSHVAFGVPGILMFLATVFFWMGRKRFAHIPPGGAAFVRETFSLTGLRCMAKLAIIYAFVAVFWALYDQTSSAWVLQAKHMDLQWLGHIWLPDQVQALNPIFILIFIPIFSYVIYPAIDKILPLTPLRKIAIGLFVTTSAFVLPAWAEMRIGAGFRPGIVWQVVAYVLMTAGEILVSIPALEFSYTQAPKRMKSLIMALGYLSISLGDAFTAAVNFFIQNKDGSSKLAGASYYWFFTGLMLGTAILFIFVARTYRSATIVQDEVETAA